MKYTAKTVFTEDGEPPCIPLTRQQLATALSDRAGKLVDEYVSAHDSHMSPQSRISLHDWLINRRERICYILQSTVEEPDGSVHSAFDFLDL